MGASILEGLLIGMGGIFAIMSTLLTINLARAKYIRTAAMGAILTIILVASLIGCATYVH